VLLNLAIVLSVAGLIVSSVSAQEISPAGSPRPLEKPVVEQILKDYILEHPEVLLESIRLYQERERAAQRQRSKEALLANLNDLQQDPASPVTGGEGGVTVVEFFDYHCGYCKRAESTVTKLLADHPEIRFVFKEFPILGQESSLGAKAGLAAAKQGEYLKFHQALMALSGPITLHAIEELAARQGLDAARLKSDMESADVQSILAHNRELAIKLGVNATPTFVVGSEVVSEAPDPTTFERLIAQAKNGMARRVVNSRNE